MRALTFLFVLLVLQSAAVAADSPNIVVILSDDKYGQGIVNREFLSENKVFYHQSVESALAAI